MSLAIDDLMHEHDAILASFQLLDGMSHTLAVGKQISADDAAQFVAFLREFGDKCHHGKEEGFLFPAMIEAGLPQQSGPIAVMLHDHTQGRAWMQAMEDALAPAFNPDAFVSALHSYVLLMRSHIAKENNVLFPMAENILEADQLQTLFDQFEAHEAQVIGAGRHEELHALLEQLLARYPAPAAAHAH
ncbi:MAG: hemerythrin domain-containing protein [Brachymonas denitrificans]